MLECRFCTPRALMGTQVHGITGLHLVHHLILDDKEMHAMRVMLAVDFPTCRVGSDRPLVNSLWVFPLVSVFRVERIRDNASFQIWTFRLGLRISPKPGVFGSKGETKGRYAAHRFPVPRESAKRGIEPNSFWIPQWVFCFFLGA